MKNVKILLFFALLSVPFLMQSQQLVYKPINPFFGGDTFNYQQLLASAEAQNKFTEDNDLGFEEQTELEQFTETLNRQLLNSLSQDLFQQEFGDDALTVGTYVFGSLVVDITPTVGGLAINVLDTTTGDQTQIIIPDN
ncbi:curli production assembly/transport component CsgF [Lutibacter oricola]|uniref:Curli production assembly/transport component CsgF n=1 Tax=Lutibacter oricola TaxID=762486 RepID=A0A1H3GMW4_9FLAO|nr:curli production assembly/transport component CsgF [Lutibacter oricola]SDY04631.1 curli production assembly/transport component CsgF [Lutibacter oricola]